MNDLPGVFFVLPCGVLVGVPLACDFPEAVLLLLRLLPLLLAAMRVGALREQALRVTRCSCRACLNLTLGYTPSDRVRS